MGFMDKAKKLAEQAQAKLDEVQKDFNETQGSGASGAPGPGAPVEYDQHGRPVTPVEDRLQPEPGPNRPHGDPADEFPDPPEAGEPTADTDVPPAPTDRSPTFPPPQPPTSSDPKPGFSSGDPLGS